MGYSARRQLMSDTVKRMDRAEITKRVERAEKLLQKGKTAEALEDYLQVLAAEPGNDTICQMAADLCLSLQRIPQAVKLLGDLFERQIEAGDATRASLTYKKLARFVTPTWEQKAAVRRTAGEVPSETGTRNLRERLSRADKTGAQTRFASDFEADSRA